MLFVSAKLHAESFFDNSIFGIAVINQSVDIEVSGVGQSATTSESGTGLGVYLDKYYKGKYRFNGTLSYIPYDRFDIAQLMVSADYLMPLNEQISFFAGLAGGSALQKYSDASISDSALGLVYGAQLGGIIYINKNIMLESGYRFRPANIETQIEATSQISTINDMSEFYFSILLMF